MAAARAFDRGVYAGLVMGTLAMPDWMELAAVGAAAYYVVKVVVDALSSSSATRAENRLKHEMIARGMSAPEIAQVVSSRAGGVGDAVDLPCASEALVEWGDDWYPALVLKVANGQFFVHYVGNGMDENEWVGAERIRFPAGSTLPGFLAPNPEGRPGVPVKAPVADEV